jgi:hypothetical protein
VSKKTGSTSTIVTITVGKLTSTTVTGNIFSDNLSALAYDDKDSTYYGLGKALLYSIDPGAGTGKSLSTTMGQVAIGGTYVPIPGSVLLLGTGLLGFGLMRFRGRRKKA